MSMLILKKKNSRDLDEAAQYEPPYLDLHCLLYSLWRGLVDNKLVQAPPPPPRTPSAILLLAVPRRLFCFGSLVILDVVCRYLSLSVLYINIEIGKIDVKC